MNRRYLLKPEIYVQLISFLLILLWVYAGLSKLINYEQSRSQMLNQVFPKGLALILTWLVPTVELLVSLLLLSSITRFWGLMASCVLLSFFSIYVALVLGNIFGRVPCSCGGVLDKMSWGQHLAFNLAFLLLALLGTFYEHKERRPYGEGK